MYSTTSKQIEDGRLNLIISNDLPKQVSQTANKLELLLKKNLINDIMEDEVQLRNLFDSIAREMNSVFSPQVVKALNESDLQEETIKDMGVPIITIAKHLKEYRGKHDEILSEVIAAIKLLELREGESKAESEKLKNAILEYKTLIEIKDKQGQITYKEIKQIQKTVEKDMEIVFNKFKQFEEQTILKIKAIEIKQVELEKKLNLGVMAQEKQTQLLYQAQYKSDLRAERENIRNQLTNGLSNFNFGRGFPLNVQRKINCEILPFFDDNYDYCKMDISMDACVGSDTFGESRIVLYRADLSGKKVFTTSAESASSQAFKHWVPNLFGF